MLVLGHHPFEGAIQMSDQPPRLMQPSIDTLGMLRDLVEALDRRIPNALSARESRIASDASELRRLALQRIDELTRPRLDNHYDQEVAEAVMSDDGPSL